MVLGPPLRETRSLALPESRANAEDSRVREREGGWEGQKYVTT